MTDGSARMGRAWTLAAGVPIALATTGAIRQDSRVTASRVDRQSLISARAAGFALAAGALTAADRLRRKRHHASLQPEDRDVQNDLPGESMRITSADGGELFVTRSGPPGGAVVVLAHCWTGSRQVWAPVARRLVGAGCQVIRWDQRGHGQSIAGSHGYTLEALADDLAAVITELSVQRAVLAGHSMGGMTAQAFAGEHRDLFHDRVSDLVLVSTAAAGVASLSLDRATPFLASAGLERIAERPVIGMTVIRGSFGPWAYWNHLQLVSQNFIDTPDEARTQFADAMLHMDLRAGISGIRVPTTILVGTHDNLTPPPRARQMASLIPDARMRLIGGVGHMLPLENAGLVADAILAHVARSLIAADTPATSA
jgi:pimeloyl-ACP methyl ester carboxylesterase